MKKVFQLDYEDKAIHKHMSFAQNQLRKVARLLRERKADYPEWQEHAAQAEGAADIMKDWQEAIRKGE